MLIYRAHGSIRWSLWDGWCMNLTRRGYYIPRMDLWDFNVWSLYAIRLIRPRKGSWLLQ